MTWVRLVGWKEPRSLLFLTRGPACFMPSPYFWMHLHIPFSFKNLYRAPSVHQVLGKVLETPTWEQLCPWPWEVCSLTLKGKNQESINRLSWNHFRGGYSCLCAPGNGHADLARPLQRGSEEGHPASTLGPSDLQYLHLAAKESSKWQVEERNQKFRIQDGMLPLPLLMCHY